MRRLQIAVGGLADDTAWKDVDLVRKSYVLSLSAHLPRRLLKLYGEVFWGQVLGHGA